LSDRVLFRQIVVVNLGKLSAVFPQLFAVAATLKSIDYNVAMTFILNNNNSIGWHTHCRLPSAEPVSVRRRAQCASGIKYFKIVGIYIL